MIEFTKENVMAMIRKDVEDRISKIRTLTEADYENDQKPAIVRKLWDLNQVNDMVFYSLMNKLHVYMTLEGWENLESVMGNLFDDAYFGIYYEPILEEDDNVHVASFHFKWCDDSYQGTVKPSEWPALLDWYLDFAKKENQFHEDLEKDLEGFLNSDGNGRCFAIIGDYWDEYPKVFRTAYDWWIKNNKYKEAK